MYLTHRGYRRIALSELLEVDVDTISAALSKKAYCWKRCRRRVKGSRDEAAFRAAHMRLEFQIIDYFDIIKHDNQTAVCLVFD